MLSRSMKIIGLYTLILVILTVAFGSSHASCPEGMESWEEYHLFFGRNTDDGQMVIESEWQNFLDQEITPRFPGGLTVIDAKGQYKSTLGTIVKESTKMVILLLPIASDTMDRIDEIMQIYGQRFQRTFFLRTVGSTCVMFSSVGEEQQQKENLNEE